jgi:prophage DNA circulation protein
VGDGAWRHIDVRHHRRVDCTLVRPLLPGAGKDDGAVKIFVTNEIDVPTQAQFDALVLAVSGLKASVEKLGEQIMGIQEAMARMRQEVEEAKGAAASAKLLIENMAARIAELAQQAAAGQAVADELANLAQELSDNTDQLAAAVAANPLPDEGGGSGPVVA